MLESAWRAQMLTRLQVGRRGMVREKFDSCVTSGHGAVGLQTAVSQCKDIASSQLEIILADSSGGWLWRGWLWRTAGGRRCGKRMGEEQIA
eukprot:1007513-Rhodomonas_salina.1